VTADIVGGHAVSKLHLSFTANTPEKVSRTPFCVVAQVEPATEVIVLPYVVPPFH
jgi:hypothetical protein